MSKWIGRLAVVVAIFALVPGILPGAVSLFGVMLSMLALVLSLFSIRKNGVGYFRVTVIIVIAGILLTNDALRVWAPIPMPLDVRLILYAMALFIVVICTLVAYRLRPLQGRSR